MATAELLRHAVVLLDGAAMAYFTASRCATLEPKNRERMRRNRLAMQAASEIVEQKINRMERKARATETRTPE